MIYNILKDVIAIYIPKVEAVLFDLDGTIYFGNDLADGADEVVDYFKRNGVHVFFASNNSTQQRKTIHNKLLDLGLDCELDEVITSGFLAALFARENRIDNIYVLGSDELISEVNEQGVTICQDESASNLIIGYAPDFTYYSLTAATRVAMNANRVIACNKERTFPKEGGRLFPGCGAMVASVEWCAERKADIVIGKPNTFFVEYIINKKQFKKDRILVVGDTYEMDVAMANNAECKSILIANDNSYSCMTVASIRDVPDMII